LCCQDQAALLKQERKSLAPGARLSTASSQPEWGSTSLAESSPSMGEARSSSSSL
jgi:hypothetical protein